jgi:hypothetical protein
MPETPSVQWLTGIAKATKAWAAAVGLAVWAASKAILKLKECMEGLPKQKGHGSRDANFWDRCQANLMNSWVLQAGHGLAASPWAPNSGNSCPD